MWPSNVKKQQKQQTKNKNKKTPPLIYLIHTHTHAHARTHAHASSFTRTHTLKKNLDSDRHSFINMNIQYIYNTQLVQKDKNYIHTCTRYMSTL